MTDDQLYRAEHLLSGIGAFTSDETEQAAMDIITELRELRELRKAILRLDAYCKTNDVDVIAYASNTGMYAIITTSARSTLDAVDRTSLEDAMIALANNIS